jgi:hypothetical protein
VRRVWRLLADERSRRVVEVVERLADGLADEGQLEAARAAARAAFAAADAARYATAASAGSAPATAAIAACYADDPATAPFYAAHAAGDDEARAAERAAQAGLLREVVGPVPLRSVAVAPSWLAWKGGLVVRLARWVYEGRRFGELPGLAFALEQAGCLDEDILRHCRLPGEHARGCWVLDRLLGKK